MDTGRSMRSPRAVPHLAWLGCLGLLIASTSIGCARDMPGRWLSASLLDGPILTSDGDAVVVAWLTDAPRTVHWVTSEDGGRRFSAVQALPAPEGYRRTLDALAALGSDAGHTAGTAGHVPLPRLNEARSHVEALASRGTRAYALRYIDGLGDARGALVYVPDTATPVPPGFALDVHGALALAWIEDLPERPGALVVRRYAAPTSGARPAETFDVAQVVATRVPATVRPTVAAVTRGVVVAWFDGSAVRATHVPLDLLCKPPSAHAAAAEAKAP